MPDLAARRTRGGTRRLGWVALSLASLLLACAREPEAGPGEVRWDRDTCERCRMTIGDRRFAAQVRTAHDHRLHEFDDLGCALLWMHENRRGDDGRDEIWVRDHQGKGWIDARTARFAGGHQTPMGYGFAVEGGQPQSIDLDDVREQVRERERERRGRRP